LDQKQEQQQNSLKIEKEEYERKNREIREEYERKNREMREEYERKNREMREEYERKNREIKEKYERQSREIGEEYKRQNREIGEEYKRKHQNISKEQAEMANKKRAIDKNIERLFSLSSSTTTSSSKEMNAGECVICLDKPRDHVCIPCYHATFCGECQKKFKVGDNCPTCRGRIERIHKIYGIGSEEY